MIIDRWAGPIEEVVLEGIERARVTPQVAEALRTAEAIVIGPSNPIISIGPILAVPGMRDALRESPAPVVAVSPFVGGGAVKGPTDDFCRSAGIELSAQGIADAYRDVVDGVVADEPVEGIPALVTDTLMDNEEKRERLARKILEFAGSLPSPGAG
jgi:LPPG:FO 2-phospho-L-lactate transferase